MSRENNKRRRNPFDTYDFDQSSSGLDQPLKVFSATSGSDPQTVAKRAAASSLDPIAVDLPPHLYIPSTAQSIDISNLVTVDPGTTEEVLRFVAPQGNTTQFIGFVIYTNAIDFSAIQFTPTVNTNRVFPYQGNPMQNFKIGLAITGDLGQNGIRYAQLRMQPSDVLSWTVTNSGTAPFAAGVRMIGYADSTIVRQSGRIGG
jgi:hypothetical protein